MNIHDSYPIISVILPTFNAEKTIKVAIQSILMQSFNNFELIIIDDGSTDNTVKIINSFSDTRIFTIIDGAHKGLARRLNEGIQCSKGKYIARMDADDISFRTRLEKQVNFLQKNMEIDLLSSQIIEFQDSGELLRIWPTHFTHDEICKNPWKGFQMPHPTWIGKSQWFKKFQYELPEVLRAEDQELLFRTYKESRFACLPEVLLAYRKNINSRCISNILASKKTMLRYFIRSNSSFNIKVKGIFNELRKYLLLAIIQKLNLENFFLKKYRQQVDSLYEKKFLEETRSIFSTYDHP